MKSLIARRLLGFKSKITLLFIFIITQSPLTSAQSVLFDFDNAPLMTSLPINLTVGGITAHFSATGQGFSIQNAGVLGFTPAGFTGRVIYPNSIYLANLRVKFDQTLTAFSIMYSCQELGCDDAATMRVTAYMHGSLVGTNTRTAANPGTWPTDTLKCTFIQGFDSVVVHYDSHPPTCQDYGVIFMADNMRVTAPNTSVILHPKLFIEGFYTGNGTMRATIDPLNLPSICDTITVELHNSNALYSIAYSVTGTIDLTGNGNFEFPSGTSGNSYYIVIRHRNSLETWSANPVLFNSSNINYDFTNSITKAFGNNLKNLGDGRFANWSGDISDAILGIGFQDGVVESADYSDMENAVYVVLPGYTPQDVTGDGIVESSDYSLMENNVYYIIASIRP